MLTLERLKTLNRLDGAGLSVDLAHEYTLDQLNAVCDLLEREQIESGQFASCPAIQCALLDNPDFLRLYCELIKNNVQDSQIEAWLKTEDQTGCRLMEHTACELLPAFQADLLSMTIAQEYLLYFLGRGLSDAQLETIQANLRYACGRGTLFLTSLDDAQRALFCHNFLRVFLSRSEMPKNLSLLAACDPLVGFLDQLHNAGVIIHLSLDQLQLLAQLNEDDFSGFQPVFDALGSDPDRMAKFLSLWLDNGGHAGDLKPFLSKTKQRTLEEIDAALVTRLSYLNLLYGGALDGIPFEEVPDHTLPLFAYALARRQSGFLRLVAQNFNLIQAVKPGTMLFNSAFFSRIALNALTIKNLNACAEDGMEKNADAALAALEQRVYTFDELHALWGAPVRYARLYNLLSIPRVDDRLLVLRQLLKRRLLPTAISDAALESLAACLSQKPLLRWRDQDFAHIQGLTYRQSVLLLTVHDKIERFISDISTEPEAAFAIRQADKLAGYAAWGDVLKDIELLDSAWERLREVLELDDAFVNDNRQHIIPFLLKEGASIAMDYESCQRNPEGFRRIVRALLMGRYQELKYFQDDLDREISCPITDIQKRRWMENTALEQDGFEVSERDDFFTVMRIGEIPERTCLHYKSGAYRECLIACFDSNKKFLFATLRGKPVARAMLRLTKGSAKSTCGKKPSLQFADLRDPANDSTEEEVLVLFLETAYTNGLDDAHTLQVKQMFIDLAVQKAAQLGALPVLSANYANVATSKDFASMNYSVYISRSKAGKQYLDSLGGANSTSNEGSYKDCRFLLPVQDMDK